MLKILKIIFSPVLWLFSVLYYIGILLDRSFKLKKQKRLPVKVICLGNITVGGTGKTSAVVQLAKELTARGHRVAILSRGYKRKTEKNKENEPVVISDGRNILVPIEYSGDEPNMIARDLKGVPVIVACDRYSSGLLAVEKFKSQILLMDDGFQHWELHRDLNILLVNALDPFGGYKLLPLGILREPLNAFKRADAVLLTNVDFAKEEKVSGIIKKIKRYNPKIQIFRTAYKPVVLERLFTRENVSLSWLNSREVAALSAIGNPYSFELTLLSLGVRLVNKLRFTDHHWYTQSEVTKLLQNKVIITTEKDAVRIESLKGIDIPKDIDFFILKTELQSVKNEESWQAKIRETLEYSLTGTAR